MVLKSIVLIEIRTESMHWACCFCFSYIKGSRGPNQYSNTGLVVAAALNFRRQSDAVT